MAEFPGTLDRSGVYSGLVEIAEYEGRPRAVADVRHCGMLAERIGRGGVDVSQLGGAAFEVVARRGERALPERGAPGREPCLGVEAGVVRVVGQFEQLVAEPFGPRQVAAHADVRPIPAQHAKPLGRAADAFAQRQRPAVGMLHLGRGIASCDHQRGAQRGLKGQFVPVALGCVGQTVEQRDAGLQMANRLLARGPPDRPPPGEMPVGQRVLGQFGLREMVGEQLGVDVPDVREPLRQGAGDLFVVLAAPALEERLIRRVTDQRVFERIAGVGQHAVLEQEFGAHQFGQSLAEFGFGYGRDGFDQLVGKLAAQRGRKLGDVTHRGEPVQPRHERVLQGGGNRQTG